LVLDEPTSGLDVKACFQYLAVVRKLMKEGKSVVIVTHHIHEIPPEVDLLLFMKQGRVVGQGPKSVLLTEERLSGLFDTPIRLLRRNGVFYAVPGADFPRALEN
jgi:iron complex transport system ATP-binding protein